MRTDTVVTSSRPIQLVAAGDGPCLIVNLDLTNTILIGNDIGMNPLNNDTFGNVPPLGSIAVGGNQDVYALPAVASASIQVQILDDAINWSASPAQIQAQISALGLATATNQVTTNNTLSFGTNPPLQAINGNHATAQSAAGNPFFTSPTGAADITGWSPSGNNIQSAGIFGAVNLPAGSGYANGVELTPSGSATFSSINPQQLTPITPGQIPYCSYMLNMNGSANTAPALTAVVTFQYYTVAGVFVANHKVNISYITANTWAKIYAEDDLGAPATAAGVLIIPEYDAIAGNIAATQTAFITAVMSGILGIGGTLGGDTSRHHAIAGSPLLHGYNVLQNPGSFQSTPAASTTSYTYTIKKPGYIIGFNAGISGAASIPVYSVVMLWQDSVTGTTLAEEIWYLSANTTTSAVVYGKGPTKGNQLTIQIHNYDPAQSLSLFWQLAETTQHIARDDWRGSSISAVPSNVAPNFATPTNQEPFGLLLANEVIVGMAANSNQWVLMPVYAGQVNIFISTSVAQAIQLQIACWDPNINTQMFAGALVFNTITPAANKVSGPFTAYLPRMPCGLNIINGGAASTIAVTVNTIEYAS